MTLSEVKANTPLKRGVFLCFQSGQGIAVPTLRLPSIRTHLFSLQNILQMSKAQQSLALKNGNHHVHHVSTPLVESIRHIQEFVSLFPPGKMEEEVMQLACIVYEKRPGIYDREQRSNILCMFNMLKKVCIAMQHVSTELGPLTRPWYLEEEL